ncbi:catalase [Jannaschia rubra]|uniref:Catalase n=1 Tax=Jannaschia rubra TaxID=282197 RepID=A0A0M6XUL7_9RHOB|nr:catalase [Jannaschia rubra]CTQ34800.1 Catalase C [Jannaschia rubra]SFG80624.1 catalase [Jannaschia rubra]
MTDKKRSQQTDPEHRFSERGAGGEYHQHAEDGAERLTTAQGVTISDNQNSLKPGASGPTLLEDFVLREKIFHFDHERIPERVVHARGFGAHGTFECKKDLSAITRAAPFQKVGKKTELFARFSTVAGNKGSFDIPRDVRGFAVKFYTDEGNWDLVGNNMPVFFIQDAIKFPDLIHAVKPEPDTGFPQAQSAHDNFWDFISLTPESMHTIMWLMSDRAIPRSFSTMEGFGVHTYRFVNADGKSTYVKFFWKPHAGLQSVVWNEAMKTNGADPDRHRRITWEEITEGPQPAWDLAVQTFDQEFADSFEFDVLDATKIIPEERLKPEIVGTMTLDRPVDNFFAETEQVAFCTQNVVPGIDFTDDPLLQGRNFSYLDTQIKRLGSPNFTKIPVNAPRGCPVHNYQQDGHMQTDQPIRGRVNYEPNGWGEGPREHPLEGYTSFRQEVHGEKARLRPESFNDHYSQARLFYISQTEVEQGHLRDAFVFELSKCEMEAIRIRIVSHLRNVDEELAAAVAERLGIETLPKPAPAAQPTRMDLDASPALSIVMNGPGSFKGRTIGVLASDGADADLLRGLMDAARAEGAKVKFVAPRIGGFTDSKGEKHPADEKVDGGPSVLFDAVAIVPGEESVAALAAMPPARDFLTDAFVHAKFIALAPAAGPLVEATGLSGKLDDGCFDFAEPGVAETFVSRCAELRFWKREG